LEREDIVGATVPSPQTPTSELVSLTTGDESTSEMDLFQTGFPTEGIGPREQTPGLSRSPQAGEPADIVDRQALLDSPIHTGISQAGPNSVVARSGDEAHSQTHSSPEPAESAFDSREAALLSELSDGATPEPSETIGPRLALLCDQAAAFAGLPRECQPGDEGMAVGAVAFEGSNECPQVVRDLERDTALHCPEHGTTPWQFSGLATPGEETGFASPATDDEERANTSQFLGCVAPADDESVAVALPSAGEGKPNVPDSGLFSDDRGKRQLTDHISGSTSDIPRAADRYADLDTDESADLFSSPDAGDRPLVGETGIPRNTRPGAIDQSLDLDYSECSRPLIENAEASGERSFVTIEPSSGLATVDPLPEIEREETSEIRQESDHGLRQPRVRQIDGVVDADAESDGGLARLIEIQPVCVPFGTEIDEADEPRPVGGLSPDLLAEDDVRQRDSSGDAPIHQTGDNDTAFHGSGMVRSDDEDEISRPLPLEPVEAAETSEGALTANLFGGISVESTSGEADDWSKACPVVAVGVGSGEPAHLIHDFDSGRSLQRLHTRGPSDLVPLVDCPRTCEFAGIDRTDSSAGLIEHGESSGLAEISESDGRDCRSSAVDGSEAGSVPGVESAPGSDTLKPRESVASLTSEEPNECESEVRVCASVGSGIDLTDVSGLGDRSGAPMAEPITEIPSREPLLEIDSIGSRQDVVDRTESTEGRQNDQTVDGQAQSEATAIVTFVDESPAVGLTDFASRSGQYHPAHVPFGPDSPAGSGATGAETTEELEGISLAETADSLRPDEAAEQIPDSGSTQGDRSGWLEPMDLLSHSAATEFEGPGTADPAVPETWQPPGLGAIEQGGESELDGVSGMADLVAYQLAAGDESLELLQSDGIQTGRDEAAEEGRGGLCSTIGAMRYRNPDQVSDHSPASQSAGEPLALWAAQGAGSDPAPDSVPPVHNVMSMGSHEPDHVLAPVETIPVIAGVVDESGVVDGFISQSESLAARDPLPLRDCGETLPPSIDASAIPSWLSESGEDSEAGLVEGSGSTEAEICGGGIAPPSEPTSVVAPIEPSQPAPLQHSEISPRSVSGHGQTDLDDPPISPEILVAADQTHSHDQLLEPPASTPLAELPQSPALINDQTSGDSIPVGSGHSSLEPEPAFASPPPSPIESTFDFDSDFLDSPLVPRSDLPSFPVVSPVDVARCGLTIESSGNIDCFPNSSSYSDIGDDADFGPDCASPPTRGHQVIAHQSFFSMDYEYSYSDEEEDYSDSDSDGPSISATSFERFARGPAPLPVLPAFDDRPLAQLFARHWREFRLSPPGDPGVVLFRLFASRPPPDLPIMELKIAEFFDRRKLEFARAELDGSFRFFAAIHRFTSLLDRDSIRPLFVSDLKRKISELLPWLISRFVPTVLNDFRVCTRSSQPAQPAFDRIAAARQGFVLKIGAFLWSRVQHVVDCELANQLVSDSQYGTMPEIRQGLEFVVGFSRKLRSQLPVFTQAMGFVLEYEEIIAKKIQFEEKARNLSPKFLLGLVFAAKRKGIVPLEVSDQRILNWALYLKVDVTAVDGKMIADESKTEIPLELWD
jgi:hypothetical protein